jgi:preprotein translocase subunit SecE
MYLKLTAAIFAVVIVTGVYFLLVDYVFSEGYQIFYQAMTGTL